MGQKVELQSATSTVYDLTQSYLDWCQKNRSQGTYDNSLKYLKSLIESVGKRLRVGEMRKHHLTKWLEDKPWGSTTQNDAVSIVKRAYNWALEEGYIAYSPIAKVRKATRKRRDIFYSPEQWEQIRQHAKGPIVDLLDFLWSTGCRPQEARILEARHIHGDVVIFAIDESKGEKHQRILFLTPASQTITNKLITKYPTGPLFRNRNGRAWTTPTQPTTYSTESTQSRFHTSWDIDRLRWFQKYIVISHRITNSSRSKLEMLAHHLPPLRLLRKSRQPRKSCELIFELLS